MELAYTTMAYKAIPMFWTGTAMLLIGVVLVAALPRLRFAPVGVDEVDDDEAEAEPVAETAEDSETEETTEATDDVEADGEVDEKPQP